MHSDENGKGIAIRPFFQQRASCFIDMAREVEAKGSKEVFEFERAFRKVAKEKPENAKQLSGVEIADCSFSERSRLLV
jgi:hypothetical protein